jgi:anhydro-N-acetylmuramic acid kinase
LSNILLKELKSDKFFTAAFPKTTGPELFNIEYVHNAILKSKTNEISVEDVLATLTRFSEQFRKDFYHQFKAQT